MNYSIICIPIYNPVFPLPLFRPGGPPGQRAPPPGQQPAKKMKRNEKEKKKKNEFFFIFIIIIISHNIITIQAHHQLSQYVLVLYAPVHEISLY